MTERSDAIAAWLLERLDLTHRPGIDLNLLATRMGVVEILEAEMAEDGRLEQDGRRATIYLRSGLGRGRQRFTLAHELAHRALIHPNAPAVAYRRIGNSDDEERLCDEVAAALLMPRHWMRGLTARPPNLSTLRYIAHHAHVSLSAALVRSREVNHWRSSLLRFSFEQDKWRLQGASGVPAEWHRSIRSSPSTHDYLNRLPNRRDTECTVPLRADLYEFEAPCQIDKSRQSAVVLAGLDSQLRLFRRS